MAVMENSSIAQINKLRLVLYLRNKTHIHILHSHHLKIINCLSREEGNGKGKINICSVFVWM